MTALAPPAAVDDLDRMLAAAGIPDSIAMADLLAAVTHPAVLAARATPMHGSRPMRALGALQAAVEQARADDLNHIAGLNAALARSYVALLDDATFEALYARATQS